MPFIYALLDPRAPDAIRYVGFAVNMSKRLSVHMAEAKVERNHRARWIQKLVREGVRPEMRQLEECAAGSEAEREIYWIAAMRAAGHNLTNSTNGGDGSPGYHHDAEARAKISAAKTGTKLSEEQKAAISASLKGNRFAFGKRRTDEQREGMRGHVKSAETRAKHAATITGERNHFFGRKHTADTLTAIAAGISRASKGVPKSEEHRAAMSEAAHLRWAKWRFAQMLEPT